MINKSEKKNERIMIVEDELIVAQNIENQLYKLGYDVPITASSGQEAIYNAEAFKPDLVLMDIKLTGDIDGISAADHIYKKFDIPVVYLTAYADEETLDRAKITDPYGYIIKPFEHKKLHSTIEIALYKHRMEEKLKESERRFRTLASSSPVGIFQTDPGGLNMYVNRRWIEIAGLPVDQSVGKAWTAALHPDDAEVISKAWGAMTQSGEAFEQEFRMKRPDGKITWVYGHAAPLQSDTGNTIGYIGTITDITVRKRLEEELLTGKKLESIGILAGGIAHDFNNLLSIILGTISIMKEDSTINSDQFVMLQSIETASAQASELAQKLITFSSGGWLNRKKTDLRQLLEEVMSRHFAAMDVSFNMELPPGLLPVDGDPNQLKQVFMNLLLNAAEFGGTENVVEIEGLNTEIQPHEENEHKHVRLRSGIYVKLLIHDRGKGIPDGNLGKVFDPYFSTKEKSSRKGLGLGLTICYSIIQKHGGYIGIEPREGGGTTVEVYLPVFIQSKSENEQPEALPNIGCRVMVVDDEPIVQDVTCKMLERLGYDVESFDEGLQALEAFDHAANSDKPFDVIFLDLINKRGAGGKETLKKVRERNSRVKVVALSAYADDAELVLLKEEGFFDVLIKPYKLGDLKRILDKIA